MSKYTMDIVKNGTAYTTIYKTAVRCVSATGTCSYYCLAADPRKLQWDDTFSTTRPFGGDMTFYGPNDIMNSLKNIQINQMKRQVGGQESGVTAFTSTTAPIAAVDVGTINTNNRDLPDFAWEFVPKPDMRIAIGRQDFLLHIKSAITGANVKVTLYKCKARYSIPKESNWALNRPLSTYLNVTSSWIPQTPSGPVQAELNTLFGSLTNLHVWGWNLAQNSDKVGLDFADAIANRWNTKQEGTTIYENRMWCKFFKVSKKYDIELVPGQAANLKLKKKKVKSLNVLQQMMQDNMLCVKGQCVFVLKIEGSIGHSSVAGDQLSKQFAGVGNRPSIGIMPAAVDVLCFKKLKAYAHYKANSQKISQVISVPDYYDNGNSTTLLPYDQFKDTAPSDYADSAAVIS